MLGLFGRSHTLRKPPNKKANTGGRPWLARLLGAANMLKPAYKPIIAQLDNFGYNTHLLRLGNKALRRGSIDDALRRHKQLMALKYLKDPGLSLEELKTKYNSYGPIQFQSYCQELAKLNPSDLSRFWEISRSSPCMLFILPSIVTHAKPKLMLEYFETLSKQQLTPIQRNALYLAVNCHLYRVGPTYSNVKAVFDALSEQVSPPLYPSVTKFLHVVNDRRHMGKLFSLLVSRKVLLNSRSMNTFLKALMCSSDANAQLVIDTCRTTRYNFWFYGYLVNELCNRYDCETVDYLLEEVLMKIVENNKKHLPFLLHCVFLRTLTFAGLKQTEPILRAMGPMITQHTWLRLCRELRLQGYTDKCFSTIKKALDSEIKLSISFVGEYLQVLVAAGYSPRIVCQCFLSLFPELEPVLAALGILRIGEKVTDPAFHENKEPALKLTTESLEFEAMGMHESWLVPLYSSVLSKLDDLHTIENLFRAYIQYARSSMERLSFGVVNSFVMKLISLQHNQALNLAEIIFKEALSKLKIRNVTPSPDKSLNELVYALCASDQLQRAEELVRTASHYRSVPIRKTTVQCLLNKLQSYPSRAKKFQHWIVSQGAQKPVPVQLAA